MLKKKSQRLKSASVGDDDEHASSKVIDTTVSEIEDTTATTRINRKQTSIIAIELDDDEDNDDEDDIDKDFNPSNVNKTSGKNANHITINVGTLRNSESSIPTMETLQTMQNMTSNTNIKYTDYTNDVCDIFILV